MRKVFKMAAWCIAGLVGLLLAVVLAWVASNWHDAEPQPRPAALALPKPQLADETNSFKALSTLGQGLPEVKAGALLSCQARTEDCFSKWTKDLSALKAARDAYGAHGARCDLLMGERFEYEELLPEFAGVNTEIPKMQGLSICGNWWLSAGVLAWAHGDKVAAITSFVQTDRYQRALLAGSHSLSGLMVSHSITRRNLQVFTALGLQDQAMASSLLPLLAPLPDEVASAKRWIAYESAFQQALLDEIARGKDMPSADEGSGLLGVLMSQLLKRGIGFHPQRTAQQIDARNLRWLRQLDGGLIAAIRAQQQAHADAEKQGWMHSLTWINSGGSIILAVAEPSYLLYFARQADLELHRELAYLAVSAQAAGIAPAQRADWSRLQTVSAATRERMTWSEGGKALSALSWEAEVNARGTQNEQLKTLRIAWPDAPPPPPQN